MKAQHLRIVRPTSNIPEMIRFYQDGLGFETLLSLKDKDGFDAVMLGHEGLGYHLTFTQWESLETVRAPSEDNLLVFYLPEENKWQEAVERMIEAGYEPVKPFNPYWAGEGKTFEDIDGYRIVLQHDAWK
jgi:uncharacterized glyoxalase superfamily protein PhnB